MSDDNTMIITLPSGDINAIGDASNFTIPMPQPINLDYNAYYEVAIIDISFSNPGNTSKSIYVLSDIVDYSIVGSSKVQILYKTEPMTQTATSLPIYYMKEDGSLVQWRKLYKNSFNSINVRLQDSTGSPIPNGATDFATVTIVIKRIR
jgi:hypothetical protein